MTAARIPDRACDPPGNLHPASAGTSTPAHSSSRPHAMNRYTPWKYIVIAISLVIGVLYTIPNFFPEVPAVQVSSAKAKVDTALLGTVEDTLKAGDIPYRGASLDPTGIKVRFADRDIQLKAKDVLQAKLGDNYIVALNLLSTSPQWLASIGALPMYLGPRSARRRVFPAAGRHEGRARQGRRPLHDRSALAAAQREDPVFRRQPRGRERRHALQGRGRAHEGARRHREDLSGPAGARRRWRRRRPAPRRGPEAGGAEAHPGRRRRAEHPDPAQSRQRTGRGGADHPAAGCRARRRPAARRAGHRARQGHPRPHRVARDPHGQRRRPARSRARSPAACRSAATSSPSAAASRSSCGGRSCSPAIASRTRSPASTSAPTNRRCT